MQSNAMGEGLVAKVAEGVLLGEYALLLGAGASMGARGGNGVLLPSGSEFLAQLVSDFGIETEGESISLRRAYEAAQRKDSNRLGAFISQQFTRCRPSWQHLLAQFRWQRIWTLNIDDVVETVLKEQGISFDRFDWTSAFRDASRSECQVVHLHGFAREPGPEGETDSALVFSTADYVAPVRDPRAWHSVFADDFAERPFIILGTSLSEEFDLQPALSKTAATATRGFPSVIVLRAVTALQREELGALGLTVVEADAHDFMTQLKAETDKRAKLLGGLYGHLMDAQAARFLQQFVDLRQYEPHSDKASRGFYSGFEPQWRNILDDDDAELQATESSFLEMQRDSQTEECQQHFHLVTGGSGTGKSTGLLRIARRFVSSGHPTFLFREEEDLDTSAALHWLKRLPSTVLVFDNCADFADSIGELAERCDDEGVRLVAIGAERSSRKRFLTQKVDAKFLYIRDGYEFRSLSDADIDSLLDKLASRRRLGRITRWQRLQQEDYFRKTAGRQLFEGMARLEGGQGFRGRIKKNFEGIEDQRIQQLYAAACIAFELGYPLSIGVAIQVSGIDAIELAELAAQDGQDLLVLAERGVRPSHRITASLVVEAALSMDLRREAMERLAYALAPHADARAIAERTRPYRLLRRLMDQETARRLLGPEGGRRLYETMEVSYSWNGRYWEQRALFESDLGNHAQARSYAEHSIAIHRHPFALNTLGTILGRIAVQTGDIGILHEAIECLQDSRDERRWDASEHPYVTYFNTMVRFGETWGKAMMSETLRSTFAEWFDRARRAAIFATPLETQTLQGFLNRWLALPTEM